MPSAKELYTKYAAGMQQSGIEVNTYETLPEADRLAWQKVGEELTTDEKKGQEFYHLNGKSAQFDIDEELGELLIAVQKSLHFIHEGPAVQVTEDIVQSMYDGHITKLIPKLEAMVANRVMVAYPFHLLVDMNYPNLMNMGANKAPPLDQIEFAVATISDRNEAIAMLVDCYEPGKNIAPDTIEALAGMAIHMQQIMNTFGWTWDDVKLKARQQLSQYEVKK